MVSKWQAKRAEAAVEEEEEAEASRPQSLEELEMAKRRRLNEWKESLSTCVTPSVPPGPPRAYLAFARFMHARSASPATPARITGRAAAHMRLRHPQGVDAGQQQLHAAGWRPRLARTRQEGVADEVDVTRASARAARGSDETD